MILSDDQKHKILDWIHARVGKAPCPACGNSDLRIEERLTALCTLTEENRAHPVEFCPMVPLTCHYCGFTRLFSARVMGLVK
jgi:predicted nucleic-acid-binding Zn-ribbon protein